MVGSDFGLEVCAKSKSVTDFDTAVSTVVEALVGECVAIVVTCEVGISSKLVRCI